MSSPIVTPPPVAPPTSPVTESSDLVIGGTRIPLPRWARFLIGIIALVGAAVPIVVTVTGKSTTGPQPQSQVFNSDAGKIQYREYQRHIVELPEYSQTLFDSSDLGSLVVNFYKSDGCLLVMRKNPGRYDGKIPYWIPAASIEAEKPPGPTSGAISQMQLLTGNPDFMAAQFQPPTVALAKVATPSVTGNCWNPHAGDFRWWNGQQSGCWLQVWRAWPDGCQHYQWFNTCNGYWDSDHNGAPRVYWTNCVH